MTDNPAKHDLGEMPVSTPCAGLQAGEPNFKFNLGSIVFVGFSVLSFIVCITQGIVPIYGVEAVAWGVMAWYWHKKNPASENATLIMLVLAVAVAAAEGYSYGHYKVGKNYTYLTQGNIQYRVDERAGRTDRLNANNGWEPVSFDRPPDEVFSGNNLFAIYGNAIVLSNGEWDATDICFDVQNNSGFVLQDVMVNVTIDPAPDTREGYDVKLQKGAVAMASDKLFIQKGGLLDVGKKGFFCGTAPRQLDGAKWKYSLSGAKGWKQ